MRFLPTAVLIGAAAVSAWAQTYTLKTFAGGALPENVAGVSASLGDIYGMTVDLQGNIYLALGDYDMVVRMDASSGALRRVAGTGLEGFSGDGKAAVDAQLSGPTGLAIDVDGNLYVADTGNSRVRKISAQGIITTLAGNGETGYSGDGGPALQARFNGLSYLALGGAGEVYVADSFNHAIRKIANGVITTVAGTGVYGFNGDNIAATEAQLAVPSGITLDKAGNLYIADGYNHRIRKVTAASGTITTVAGNGTFGFAGDGKAATAANLKAPSDVALDTAGNLYIADLGNNRIRVIGANGNISTFAGNGSTVFSGDRGAAASSGLLDPECLVVDSTNNVYIADGFRVRKVASQVITTVAGGGAPAGENGPPLKAQIASPQGLAVDSAGTVFIADAGTGRVVKVTNDVLSRVAGIGVPGFSGDGGAATDGAMFTPAGLTVDASGSLYIADSTGARVRKVAGGVITTAAGVTPALSYPLGVAVDAGGNLYISDSNRVRAVSAGAMTTFAGTGSAGYQGDAGPATAAYVSTPDGLAVDAAGNLLIADSGNNRLRMVSNGVITTVAGNGNYGMSGYNGTAAAAMLASVHGVTVDGAGDIYLTDDFRVLKISKSKITTLAGLNAPEGIAVDTAGDVYVSEPAMHRVHVLTPAANACAVTVGSPLQMGSAGGAAVANIQTAASCPWTIESLPAWITVAGNPFGSGAATATLQFDPNPNPPRTATIVIGGQNVVVTQAGVLTIAGQINGQTGSPMAGVTVALSGGVAATVVTDSGGNFSFTGLNSADTFTITPSLSGYVFVPPSLNYANATANPTPTFAAWPAPSLSEVFPAFVGALQPTAKSFAAGEVIAIYGSQLCGDPSGAAPALPDRIAGCIAQVDGVNLRVYFGSPGQVNAVLPQILSVGQHRLVVRRYTDTAYRTLVAQTAALAITVDRIAMAFVERTENGSPLLAAQFLDGGYAGAARPAKAGDYIELYLTGLGRKAQTFTEGAAPGRAISAVETVQAQVQGVAAQVAYAGVQPQYPGLDQITIRMPQYTLPADKKTVTLQITAPATGQTLTYELPAN